jgi:hypothetical protein
MLLAIVIILILIIIHHHERHIYRFPCTNVPRILLIAGQHGNEPAATYVLSDFVTWWKQNPPPFDITIIPRANPIALALGIRGIPDMNRYWFRQLDYDMVIDFHEGWGNHKKQPQSLGQTIWTNSKFLATYIVPTLVNKLNKSVGPDLQWTQLDRIPDVGYGTLDQVSPNYILVETSGQNNIVPLHIRMKQINTIIHTLLKKDMLT